MKTGKIGIEKEDDNTMDNTYSILSNCNILSFVDKKSFEFDPLMPPPLYLKQKDLKFVECMSPKILFSEFEINKDGRLKCTDAELISKQKSVIIDIFKTAVSKILEGKLVVGMSLPIKIFQPRSYLERITDLFSAFPYYLSKVKKNNEVENIKLISAAICAGLINLVNQWKPFNPILGETYQGFFGDGTKIYGEHISHHPPISSITIENKKWTLSYTCVVNGKIQLNSIKPFNEGIIKIEFKEGFSYYAIIPVLNLDGSLIGSRFVSFDKCLVVWGDKYKANIIMGSESTKGLASWFSKGKTEFFKGKLYEYNKEIHEEILKLETQNFYGMLEKICLMEDVITQIEEISGSWYENLYYNDKLYWDFKQDYDLQKIKIHEENPLPSDSRFREDLLWLEYKNIDYAQNWKHKLEAQQRKDRETRKNNN